LRGTPYINQHFDFVLAAGSPSADIHKKLHTTSLGGYSVFEMGMTITDNAEAPELALQVLKQHLPHSIATLRRLQFMSHPGGAKTPDSHILSTFDTSPPGQDFFVACLDFSRGPDTEMWLYSSLENPSLPSNQDVCEAQILSLISRVREIEAAYSEQRATPGILLIGSLHKRVFEILQKHELVQRHTAEHLKFLFILDDLPLGGELPDGMGFSEVGAEDIPLVLSRTAIPYQASVSFF
jgi:hypothetical protein